MPYVADIPLRVIPSIGMRHHDIEVSGGTVIIQLKNRASPGVKRTVSSVHATGLPVAPDRTAACLRRTAPYKERLKVLFRSVTEHGRQDLARQNRIVAIIGAMTAFGPVEIPPIFERKIPLKTESHPRVHAARDVHHGY